MVTWTACFVLLHRTMIGFPPLSVEIHHVTAVEENSPRTVAGPGSALVHADGMERWGVDETRAQVIALIEGCGR